MTKSEKKKAILEKQFEMAMEGSIEMLKWEGIRLDEGTCGHYQVPEIGRAAEGVRGFTSWGCCRFCTWARSSAVRQSVPW